MARLDRLSPVKEVAQIGAAIGRDFSFALLRTVAAKDEAALKTALAQLEAAGLILSREWRNGRHLRVQACAGAGSGL